MEFGQRNTIAAAVSGSGWNTHRCVSGCPAVGAAGAGLDQEPICSRFGIAEVASCTVIGLEKWN